MTFTIAGAWSSGCKVIAPRLPAHILILAIIGIGAPLALEYLLKVGNVDAASQTIAGGAPVGFTPLERPMILLGLAFGYALQGASYFAVWRLVFGGRQPAVAALAYGLSMGLLVALLGVGAHVLGEAGARLTGGPDTWMIGMFVYFLPLIVIFALFFTVLAVMIGGVVVALFLLLVVRYGAGGAGVPPDLFEGAGGGFTALFILLSALTLWLSTRMSCVATLLAAQGGFNLPAAIGKSWRRTAQRQWAILRYLASIGGVLAVLLLGGAYLFGAGLAGVVQPAETWVQSEGLAILLRFGLGLPFALLAVLVPLGIHRQLTGEAPPVEVFD